MGHSSPAGSGTDVTASDDVVPHLTMAPRQPCSTRVCLLWNDDLFDVRRGTVGGTGMASAWIWSGAVRAFRTRAEALVEAGEVARARLGLVPRLAPAPACEHHKMPELQAGESSVERRQPCRHDAVRQALNDRGHRWEKLHAQHPMPEAVDSPPTFVRLTGRLGRGKRGPSRQGHQR